MDNNDLISKFEEIPLKAKSGELDKDIESCDDLTTQIVYILNYLSECDEVPEDGEVWNS